MSHGKHSVLYACNITLWFKNLLNHRNTVMGHCRKQTVHLPLRTVFSSLIESDACRFLLLRKLKLLFLSFDWTKLRLLPHCKMTTASEFIFLPSALGCVVADKQMDWYPFNNPAKASLRISIPILIKTKAYVTVMARFNGRKNGSSL